MLNFPFLTYNKSNSSNMFRKSIRFSYCDYRFLFYLLPNLFYMILIISLLNILNFHKNIEYAVLNCTRIFYMKKPPELFPHRFIILSQRKTRRLFLIYAAICTAAFFSEFFTLTQSLPEMRHGTPCGQAVLR